MDPKLRRSKPSGIPLGLSPHGQQWLVVLCLDLKAMLKVGSCKLLAT